MTLSSSDVTRVDESLGSGTNVLGTTGNQPSTSRPVLVMLEIVADPSSTSGAQVDISIDHDNDGATDMTHQIFAQGGLGTARRDLVTIYLLAGGTYDVTNVTDPDAANSATEFIVEL